MIKLALPFMLAVTLNSQVSSAQESQPAPKQPSSFAGTDSPEALREHVPVLPAVRAKYWNIDPAVGYGIKDFENGVYALSDNGWQSAFLVTEAGVIVFDAPASYGKHIPEAVAKVTNKPVEILSSTWMRKSRQVSKTMKGTTDHTPTGRLWFRFTTSSSVAGLGVVGP
jgi:hypothetical protein